LLDFRYNTQEEIDKLNNEMDNDEQLNENKSIEGEDESVIRERDEKEADSILESNLE
jgi:hypothetical protein